jgi:hypothetical protein
MLLIARRFRRIDFQASEMEVKAALEELDTIGRVNVVYTDKAKAENMLAVNCPATVSAFSTAQTMRLTGELLEGGGHACNNVTLGGVDEDFDGVAETTKDSLLPCVSQPCTWVNTACSLYATNRILVEFLTEFGDLPPIEFVMWGVAQISVGTNGLGQSVKGTKGAVECSNRGLCDTETGQCTCFPGYSSSDGAGGPGDRGDCGHKDIQGIAQ